jgi:Ca2+-binding EF-hand superfamily protein
VHLIQLDKTNESLKSFFLKNLSKDKFIDLNHLQDLLVSHYGSPLGSQLFKKLSKHYTRINDGHSKHLDFDDYVDLTQNLLNRSGDFRTRLFFQVIDFN